MGCSQDESVDCLADTALVLRVVHETSEPKRNLAHSKEDAWRENEKNLFGVVNGVNRMMPSEKRLPRDVTDAYAARVSELKVGDIDRKFYRAENKPLRHTYEQLQRIASEQYKKDPTSDAALMGLLYLSGEKLPPTRYDHDQMRIVGSIDELGPHENGYIPSERRIVIKKFKTRETFGVYDFKIPDGYSKLINALGARANQAYVFEDPRSPGNPIDHTLYSSRYNRIYHGIDATRQAYITRFLKGASWQKRKWAGDLMGHDVLTGALYERQGDEFTHKGGETGGRRLRPRKIL
eukprot:jgi/Mesvir1/15713/Mv26145-RA.1